MKTIKSKFPWENWVVRLIAFASVFIQGFLIGKYGLVLWVGIPTYLWATVGLIALISIIKGVGSGNH